MLRYATIRMTGMIWFFSTFRVGMTTRRAWTWRHSITNMTRHAGAKEKKNPWPCWAACRLWTSLIASSHSLITGSHVILLSILGTLFSFRVHIKNSIHGMVFPRFCEVMFSHALMFSHVLSCSCCLIHSLSSWICFLRSLGEILKPYEKSGAIIVLPFIFNWTKAMWLVHESMRFF